MPTAKFRRPEQRRRSSTEPSQRILTAGQYQNPRRQGFGFFQQVRRDDDQVFGRIITQKLPNGNFLVRVQTFGRFIKDQRPRTMRKTAAAKPVRRL